MATTSHYGFTLFEGSDHPTWLTDWNNTITAIDNTIHRIATGGGDLPDLTEVVARLQALEGRVDSDELRLNVVEGDIVDILSDLSTISSDLSALATRVTTAESDIDTLESAVNTTLPAQLQTINDSITGILSSISGLDTRVTTAEGNISTNSTNINGLDTRVTALENAGGGGNMQITEHSFIEAYTPNSLALLRSTNHYNFLVIGGGLISYQNQYMPYNSIICNTNDPLTYLCFTYPWGGFYVGFKASSLNSNFTADVYQATNATSPKVYGVKFS